MTRIIVVLALAIATLAGCAGTGSLRGDQAKASLPPQATPAPQPVAQATIVTAARTNSAKHPSAYESLKPFKQFAKGEGEGVARVYKSRSKAQFVALLRDKNLAKKEMRVTCEILVRQMMEAHPGLPFEGCEGAAAAIERDSNFVVAVCRDDMFLKDNWLTVANEDGTEWGAWHRKCLAGEQVLAYKGRPLISLTCLNVVVPVPVQRVAAPTGTCLDGWSITAHARSFASLPEGLRKEVGGLIAAANARESLGGQKLEAYQPESVSRIGKRVREGASPPPVTANIIVRYVNIDSQTKQVVTQDIGALRMVNGIGTFRFSDDPRQRIVGFVWPTSFVSPTVSGAGGERQLRVFPKEWGTWCSLNITGLVP